MARLEKMAVISDGSLKLSTRPMRRKQIPTHGIIRTNLHHSRSSPLPRLQRIQNLVQYIPLSPSRAMHHIPVRNPVRGCRFALFFLDHVPSIANDPRDVVVEYPLVLDVSPPCGKERAETP